MKQLESLRNIIIELLNLIPIMFVIVIVASILAIPLGMIKSRITHKR